MDDLHEDHKVKRIGLLLYFPSACTLKVGEIVLEIQTQLEASTEVSLP